MQHLHEERWGRVGIRKVKPRRVWSFRTNQNWKASPMTYMFDGKQVVAVAAGPNIIALTIHD